MLMERIATRLARLLRRDKGSFKVRIKAKDKANLKAKGRQPRAVTELVDHLTSTKQLTAEQAEAVVLEALEELVATRRRVHLQYQITTTTPIAHPSLSPTAVRAAQAKEVLRIQAAMSNRQALMFNDRLRRSALV